MKVLGILFVVCCLAPTLSPEWLGAGQSQPVIRMQVNLINVLFTAFNTKGEHVPGLSKSDLEVFEDGIKQDIEFFAHQGDAQAEPLTIVLLVDTSGSVRDKLALEQTIALDFFKQALRPRKDLAAVMEFGSEITLAQDFTDDMRRLEAALQSLRAGGNTALYDAIYLAAEEKLKLEAGRKVVLVVSDGEDTSSKVGRKDAIEAAQRNDAIIFAVGVKSSEFSSDFDALEELARETGGRFLNPRANSREIAGAFQEILTTLKQQYNVSYYSKNQKKDGAFRRIQIRVKRAKIRVQHRSGYYAPRP